MNHAHSYIAPSDQAHLDESMAEVFARLAALVAGSPEVPPEHAAMEQASMALQGVIVHAGMAGLAVDAILDVFAKVVGLLAAEAEAKAGMDSFATLTAFMVAATEAHHIASRSTATPAAPVFGVGH